MTRLEIRQRRSAIGEKEPVRRTLDALGLRRTGARVSHEDSAALRGMLRRVEHLIEVRGTDLGMSEEPSLRSQGPLPLRRDERIRPALGQSLRSQGPLPLGPKATAKEQEPS